MIEQEEIRERIRGRLALLDLPLTGKFYTDRGIGGTTVRNYLQGMSQSLTVDTVVKLAPILETTPLWLLTGDESGPRLSADDIRQLVRNAMLEAQPGMSFAEIEPIVSEAIHAQLERLQSDGEDQGDPGKASARDKGARSRAPTKPTARE